MKIHAVIHAAFALLLSACVPPVDDSSQSPERFTATIVADEATKTLLAADSGGERKVLWKEGDGVIVGGATYTARDLTDGGTTAVLYGSGAKKEGAVYKAYYPESVYNKIDGTLSLPQELTYMVPSPADGNLVVASSFPMYAEADPSNTFRFKNLCAVLNFQLKGSGNVGSIEVKSGTKPLWGTFSVVNDAAVIDPSITAEDHRKVTLVCTTAVALDATKPVEFCIPIPAAEYQPDDLTVTVLDENGKQLMPPLKNSSLAKVEQSKIYEIGKDIKEKSMQIVIQTDADNQTLIFPFEGTLPYDLKVDWGDGSTDEYPAGTSWNDMSHGYEASRNGVETTVTITGSGIGGLYMHYQQWVSPSEYLPFKKLLRKLPTPILPVEGETLIQSFCQCIFLTDICHDLFADNPQVKDFTGVFRGCSSLRKIYDDLFAENKSVTTFESAFEGCSSLEGEIPAGLFAQNKEVKNFKKTFYGCSNLKGEIPAGLFVQNGLVTTFEETFNRCSKLEGEIPAGLFAGNKLAESFKYTFGNCEKLTSIPNDLFKENGAAKDFERTFVGCSSLVCSIPEDLFKENKLAENFNGTFQDCVQLYGPIPEKLFAENKRVTTFNYTFSSCKELTFISEKLFAENKAVTEFEATFLGCKGVKSIPENLFVENKGVKSFAQTFSSTGVTTIPSGLFVENKSVTNFSSTFSTCQDLEDIPPHLFDENVAVEAFESVFAYCYKVQSIPAGLFDNNRAVIWFTRAFIACYAITTIPPGLFDNNREAKYFGHVFNSCVRLSSIPAGLFAYNKKAEFFNEAMNYCYSLVLSDDIFIKPSAGITASNRFDEVSSISFERCFANRHITTHQHSDIITGGTAPALWSYPSLTRTGITVTATQCFADRPNLTNIGAVPSEWR